MKKNVGVLMKEMVTEELVEAFSKNFVEQLKKSAAFRIENARGVKIKSANVIGMRPIDLYGKIEMIVDDFMFTMPYPRNTNAKLEYVMIFSKEIFLDVIKKQHTFANQLVLSYSDYFENTGEKYNSNQYNSERYRNYLKQLRMDMSEYFFSNDYKETDIDDFIADHPDILKYGLGLIKYKSQVIMKDIHGEYGQDLKPDLIGFDSITESWFIVDYKLPWKKLIRGSGTVRASVTSDITVLKKQLKVYRDYFSDKHQREYVNDHYELDVKKYPPTIGVIGTVKPKEREEFNEERLEYPGWFKIISYDELYKKVCEYIDVATKIG